MEASIIGVDIAKTVFQVHGAKADGEVVFRRRLTRSGFERFMAQQAPTVVALEACGGAHHWARSLQAQGHEVRLLPPAYVTPYVKRNKTDAADAEAIAEAASRATMRFVAVKTAEQQSRTMLVNMRDLLVRQRTQQINQLRGHLAEFGIVVSKGPAQLVRLRRVAQEPPAALPAAAVELLGEALAWIDELDARIAVYDRRIKAAVAADETAARLTTVPGIGPIAALTLTARPPPMETFRSGRAFAAWVGVTPRQASSGERIRSGPITRCGQRQIRRLLILGATAVVKAARRRPPPAGSWLARMLAAGKKPKVIAVALANKMARVVWALMVRGGVYEAGRAA